MSELSQLQVRLNVLLQNLVPAMKERHYTFVFTRTRTKNAQAAKWTMTVNIEGRKQPLTIKSAVPARDLAKSTRKVIVLSENKNELWVGYSLNVDAVVEQLKASPLWVPRVQKAVERTLTEIKAAPPSQTKEAPHVTTHSP